MLTRSQQLLGERDQFRRFSPGRWPQIPDRLERLGCRLDCVEDFVCCWLHQPQQGKRQGQTHWPSVLAVPAWSVRSGRILRRQDASVS